MGATEACWRIFEYSLHERYPSVENLDIHLEESVIENEETLHIMFVLNPEKFPKA